MNPARTVLWAALAAGCARDPTVPAEPASAAPRSAAMLPAWGPAVPAVTPVLRQAELDRDPGQVAEPRTPAGAWSLARIGAPGSAASSVTAAQDPTSPPSVLVAAAFLEPPKVIEGVWVTLEDALWSRYAVSTDPAESRALLLAIARIGGPRSQIRLAADLAAPPDPEAVERHVAGMETAGMLCARGHPLSEAGLTAVTVALRSSAAASRRGGAYALGRCAGVSAERLAGAQRRVVVENLTPLVSGEDDDEIRLAWRAFAGLGEVPRAIPESVLGGTGLGWAAEVEAVRALAGHADGRVELAARLRRLDPGKIDGPKVHVLTAALSALRAAVAGTPELTQRLEPLAQRVAGARGSASARSAKALALIGCELAVLDAIVRGDTAAVATCGRDAPDLPPAYGAALAVEAYVHMGDARSGDERVTALLDRAADPRPEVAAPALSALADIEDPRVAQRLRHAVARSDVGVQAAAAAAIAARSADHSRRDPGAAQELAGQLRATDNATAVEARVAAVEGLGALARSAPQDAPVPEWLEQEILPLAADPAAAIRHAAAAALFGRPDLRQRFDAAVPASFPGGFQPSVRAALEAAPGSGLRLHTAAGVIEIAFEGAPAPIAQAGLVALARKGYFDGLRFHRVVPGFVIQGGDPRGDGYGGPGFLLPCERSNLRYERGSVGIALAGKDTGGSQFFIAQTRQPHLDARYTIIGRVTRGMTVVDSILVHDTIERVEVVDVAP